MMVDAPQSLDQFVANARLTALTGLFDGTRSSEAYMLRCRHSFEPMRVTVIFTRDIGHHSSGWWKNPDYERCWHLSSSFWVDGSTRLKREKLARAFFGDDVKLTWIEPPYSAVGKRLSVWHYRLFCDEGWQPIKPTGEVYSRRMPAGWQSFSEQHARSRPRATPPTDC